ncbi:hypothetical protein OG948_19220 [Embleya sp. NBC_00888]|uniref:hypothetical protein n=1 Tax=Embleya sp. NBC_00888 TaxID=2975960 RepID=UPI003868C5CD|nr:hypothetical protein OG948_19220 [Embleya sp. NBC_00888]
MTEPIRELSVPNGPINTGPLGIPRQSTAENRALLCRILTDAGVELGTYDRLIVDWLGDWDSPTVLTVASLIARAADPNGQSETYRTLADAITSTMAYPDDWDGDAPEHVRLAEYVATLAEYFGRTE